jgi:hypothetical protein
VPISTVSFYCAMHKGVLEFIYILVYLEIVRRNMRAFGTVRRQ